MTTVPLASIQRPSEILYIADAANWQACGADVAYANVCHSCDAPNQVPANTRHNEGSNIGFCDGHAKWLAASVTRDGDWDTDHVTNWAQ